MSTQGGPTTPRRRTSILHQVLMGLALGILIYVITLLVSVYVG